MSELADASAVSRPDPAKPSGASAASPPTSNTINGAQSSRQPPEWQPAVLPRWQRDRRRNGAGIVSLFLVALLAWITASQTFIVLNGDKLVHPSSLGWPFFICLAGIALGGYVFLAADNEWLPIPGREYEKPDHSTKYSLWFQEPTIEWLTYSDEPEKLFAQVGILLRNGGRDSPISARIEHLDVELNGINSTIIRHSVPLRMLPGRERRFMSGRLDDIPHGNMSGAVSYSITYGPVSGFPVYERTHKFTLQVRMPVTPDLIRSGNIPGLTWAEVEPERDINIYPAELPVPARAARIKLRPGKRHIGP